MNETQDVNIPILHCKQCGHEWNPRVPNPKKCPACQSYKWNEQKVEKRVHVMVSEQKESGLDIQSLVKNKLKEE